MDLIWAFEIPMRDGIRLNGTVFKPSRRKKGCRLSSLSPLTSRTATRSAPPILQSVLIDARGRGSSEGEFDPFAQEPHDRYDVGVSGASALVQ